MCGLVGVASSERHKNSKARKEALFDAIWMNTLRGDHSTGLAAVRIGQETGEPLVYKRAVSGPDFLQMTPARKILDDIDQFSMLIGHNRYSTIGNQTNGNAHPFQFDHITFAHNGHITNHGALLPLGKHCPIYVDSASAAMAMALVGEQEVLEKAQGAFAFVWHNAKDGTLNFARNSSRPLKFCYVKGENTMWWMSERTMLVSVLDRNNIPIEGPFYNVPENLWIKFNIKDLREYHTVPFVPRSLHTSRTAAGQTGAGSDAGGAGTGRSDTTPKTEPKGDWIRGARIAAAQEKLIASLLASCEKPSKEEITKREFDIRKGSSRPQGQKKVRRTSQKLGTSGFSYDQMVVVELDGWKAYQNQLRVGSTQGKIFNTDVRVHLSSVPLDSYRDYKAMDVILCRIVNMKPDKASSSQMLIVEPHPMAREFCVVWKRRWNAVKNQMAGALPAPKEVDKSFPQPLLSLPRKQPAPANDDHAHEANLTHCGPGGTTVSAARYGELTKNGCCICSGDLPQDAAGSRRIIWIDPDPVCIDCANNPKNVQEYGLPRQPGMLH